MNQIAISDQHLKALSAEGHAATVLSEWLDELLVIQKMTTPQEKTVVDVLRGLQQSA